MEKEIVKEILENLLNDNIGIDSISVHAENNFDDTVARIDISLRVLRKNESKERVKENPWGALEKLHFGLGDRG